MLPKVIASSVIRSSQMGNSHGGLYIINLQTEEIEKAIDWDNQRIDWDGRGGERGLRGIDFHNEKVFLASSNEIYVYDKHLNLIEILKNKYLRHNHEICIFENKLYITSTGFDSIIVYDIIQRKFIKSFCIRRKSGKSAEGSFIGRRKRNLRNSLNLPQIINLEIFEFDPMSKAGPKEGDTIHLNNVFIDKGQLYFSGTKLENVYSIYMQKLLKLAKLHYGTHNVKKYKNGFLLNNTYYRPKQISYLNQKGKLLKSFPIVELNKEEVTHSHLPDAHAVQGFGRGLCTFNNYIIGGSSPATVSVYDFESKKLIKTITISNDIRNAIHGLEIWPH